MLFDTMHAGPGGANRLLFFFGIRCSIPSVEHADQLNRCRIAELAFRSQNELFNYLMQNSETYAYLNLAPKILKEFYNYQNNVLRQDSTLEEQKDVNSIENQCCLKI